MHDTSCKKQFAKTIIITTTLISVGYAMFRYNIVGNVSWKDFPIFILNKGFSLASLILLVLNFSLTPLKNLGVSISDNILDARKSLGIAGFSYAFVHLIMSISILAPAYFPVFFVEEGTLSVRGGLCLLGGIVSFIFLWVYYRSFKLTTKKTRKISVLITSRKGVLYTMFFIGIHLFFLGYTGWITHQAWPGGLPPISLLSFIIFLLGFLINLIGRK